MHAARFVAVASMVAVLAGMFVPETARAAFDLVHVNFGTPIRSGANTVAFSADGALGFAAAYGRPEIGDPANRVYSFDTTTGAVVDSAELSGLSPRQVAYCTRNGYVAVRHDGIDPTDPRASIDVLLTNTGVKSGGSDGQTPGMFSTRIAFDIWDPYEYLDGRTVPAQDALDDLAFTSDGEILFYSNGGQIFGANTQSGLKTGVDEVSSRVDLVGGDVITFFSYTPSTVSGPSDTRVPELARRGGEVGFLSVGVSHNVIVPDDRSTPDVNEFRLYPSSRILNFKVWSNRPDGKPDRNGNVDLRDIGATYLSTVDLPSDGITEGSNVFVDPSGRYGLVLGADSGNLYSFRVDSGAIRRVTPIEGFAARPHDLSGRGPRRITVSSAGSIVVSRPGNISRPTNVNISRPTNVNISRPTNVNEAASVVLCEFTDRGRVVVVGAVTDFGESSSISNLVFDGSASNAYFTTTDGLLHAISVEHTTVTTVGTVGVNAWSLALHAASDRIAVVNGMQVDEAGSLLDAGGVTLGVLDTVAQKTHSGVGSPVVILPPVPSQISRPYGTCVTGH